MLLSRPWTTAAPLCSIALEGGVVGGTGFPGSRGIPGGSGSTERFEPEDGSDGPAIDGVPKVGVEIGRSLLAKSFLLLFVCGSSVELLARLRSRSTGKFISFV